MAERSDRGAGRQDRGGNRDGNQRRDNQRRDNQRKDGQRRDDRGRDNWGRDDRRQGDKRDDRRGDRRDDRRGDRRDDRRDNRRGDRRDDRRDNRRDSRRDDRRGDRRDDRRDRREDEERRFPGQRRPDSQQRGRRDDRRDSRRDGRRDSKRDDRRRGPEKPHTAEYRSADPNEPVIPAGISADELDAEARAALETLSGANQEIVARHLVMAGELLDIDPDLAYKHAQAAVGRAGRVDVVREAAALTAYATGRYEEALREVRAVRRMRGDESLRAIEADCERGLGRPERALQVLEETSTAGLPLSEQAELVLVAAGARMDLDQSEVALLLVEDALHKLPEDADEDVRRRLMSFQADLLRKLGREEDAAAVDAATPMLEDPMEFMDLGELIDADVDHTRTPLRGSPKALTDVYDTLVLDLDGVCFAGTDPIDHAASTLQEVDQAGTKLTFATNNASRTPEQVAEKLHGFRIPATEENIITSAMDLMYLLGEDLALGDKVLVVGADALRDAVAQAGFEPVGDAKEPVAAVVQGYGPDVDWALLSEAAYAINDGARYYATNLDASLPTERGMALGNGALVAAVTRATGKRPQATGKPNPDMLERVAQQVEAESPLGVGDRLETDIAAAVAARMPAMHVLTGVSTAKDVVSAKRGERPAYLALDLRGLQEAHPQPKHHRDGTWTAGYSQPVQFTRWGFPVIDEIEIRADGDPITISLDTYRALAAAGWEATDDGRSIRMPEIVVVDNDDPAGIVSAPNYEVEEPEETTEEGAEDVPEAVATDAAEAVATEDDGAAEVGEASIVGGEEAEEADAPEVLAEEVAAEEIPAEGVPAEGVAAEEPGAQQESEERAQGQMSQEQTGQDEADEQDGEQ